MIPGNDDMHHDKTNTKMLNYDLVTLRNLCVLSSKKDDSEPLLDITYYLGQLFKIFCGAIIQK